MSPAGRSLVMGCTLPMDASAFERLTRILWRAGSRRVHLGALFSTPRTALGPAGIDRAAPSITPFSSKPTRAQIDPGGHPIRPPNASGFRTSRCFSYPGSSGSSGSSVSPPRAAASLPVSASPRYATRALEISSRLRSHIDLTACENHPPTTPLQHLLPSAQTSQDGKHATTRAFRWEGARRHLSWPCS